MKELKVILIEDLKAAGLEMAHDNLEIFIEKLYKDIGPKLVTIKDGKDLKNAIVDGLKSAGLTMAEHDIELLIKTLCETTAPKLVTLDNPVAKMIGSGIVTIYPLVKDQIYKAIDLDKDGQ